MPTTTFVLELTEEELTVIWGLLIVVHLSPSQQKSIHGSRITG